MGTIENIRLAGPAAFATEPESGALNRHTPELLDVLASGEPAAFATDSRDRVVFCGASATLVERLQEPLRRALEGRGRFYVVEIDAVGRVGEVVVSISSSRGRLPLLFGPEDLEPGYVHRIVSDTVERFGL
jgi:hypothetical protein